MTDEQAKPVLEQMGAIAAALYADILKRREHIIEAFIAETGLKPSGCEMVEDHTNTLRIVFSVRAKEAGQDTARIDAVERNQWNPRCVDWQQWELDDHFMHDKETGKVVPHTLRGRSWREVVDGARSGPYGA